MKVLIGTDILFHYLLKKDYIDGIELLLKWLDKINAKKMVDVSSMAILTNFFPLSKFDQLSEFTLLNSVPGITSNSVKMKKKINELSRVQRKAANTLLAHLNIIDAFEVDFLVTENMLAHSIAKIMGIDVRIYSIEGFIEKCTIEHRMLDDAKGVVVEKCKFGSLSLEDPFFQIFINEYQPYFRDWFKEKKEDDVYISRAKDGYLKALLKFKYEFPDENYTDIIPVFKPANRMKIASFKVDYNGEKLGERFLRIVFEKAIENQVEEIYITLFNTSKIRRRLVDLLDRWGFTLWGYKKNTRGRDEEVYCRNLKGVIKNDIQKDYPYHKIPTTSFIIPIHKNYSNQLIPEDTLINDYYDIVPSKHSIRKILVLHSCPGDLDKGSVLFFYKLSSTINERSIISVGITECVYKHFNSEQDFISRCRKRSVLSDKELSVCWMKSNGNPIAINFIHICDFNNNEITAFNLKDLGIKTNGMISQIPIPISLQQYFKLIKNTKYEKCVDFCKA